VPRTPIVLLVVALAGMLGGGALIGVWALGLCLIADSVAVAVFALWHDWPERAPRVTQIQHGVSLAEVLERARSA
jgi:hypothetical protein